MIDPEPAADEAMPRGVSMIWGEVCDVQVSVASSLLSILRIRSLFSSDAFERVRPAQNSRFSVSNVQ